MDYALIKVPEDGISRVVKDGLTKRKAIAQARKFAKENPETTYYVIDEEELKIHFVA